MHGAKGKLPHKHSGRLLLTASEKSGDSVIAQVEFISQIEARYRRQGDHPTHRVFLASEAQSEMTSGGVSQQDHTGGLVEVRAGSREAVDDILECTRPSTAWVADASIFQARDCQAGPRQRGAGVARMRQVILRAPKSTMDHHDRTADVFSFFSRLPQVKKLIRFGAVSDSLVGRNWRQREKVASHSFQLTRSSSPKNLSHHH
jgi:hypothetical protein